MSLVQATSSVVLCYGSPSKCRQPLFIELHTPKKAATQVSSLGQKRENRHILKTYCAPGTLAWPHLILQTLPGAVWATAAN